MFISQLLKPSLALGFLCLALPALAQVFPQPSYEIHKEFLISEWDPMRPSVLVFKDPFCPYCLRDIPKLPEITDYNVFFFWSPILGQRSVSTVDQIFRCPKVASQALLNTVKERQPVDCEGEMNQVLKAINDEMVAAYNINAVPSYFLHGKRVSRSLVSQPRKSLERLNGVKIDWQRYAMFKQRSFAESHSLLMILAESDLEQWSALDARYKPHYLIPSRTIKSSLQERCKKGEAEFCDSGFIKTYINRAAELMLLLGQGDSDQSIVFDHKGQQSSANLP